MDVDMDDKEKEDGFKVVVVSGLTKNVHRGHLMEIFQVYGKVTGLDLPLFKVCMSDGDCSGSNSSITDKGSRFEQRQGGARV